MIRAALITELGAGAICGEISEDPTGDGESTVTMEAAALNPVDLAIAGGSFHAGHPELPYVPGIEAKPGEEIVAFRESLDRKSQASDAPVFLVINRTAALTDKIGDGIDGRAGLVLRDLGAEHHHDLVITQSFVCQ